MVVQQVLVIDELCRRVCRRANPPFNTQKGHSSVQRTPMNYVARKATVLSFQAQTRKTGVLHAIQQDCNTPTRKQKLRKGVDASSNHCATLTHLTIDKKHRLQQHKQLTIAIF